MVSVAGRRHYPVEVPDRSRIARELRKAVDGEVRFDPGSRAIHARKPVTNGYPPAA
jgi:hypothetical protein